MKIWYSNPATPVGDQGFSQAFMEWVVSDMPASNSDAWVELVMFELGWGL